MPRPRDADLSPTEVLIAVHACVFNSVDLSSLLRNVDPASVPAADGDGESIDGQFGVDGDCASSLVGRKLHQATIPGRTFSGVVAAVGVVAATRFSVGLSSHTLRLSFVVGGWLTAFFAHTPVNELTVGVCVYVSRFVG